VGGRSRTLVWLAFAGQATFVVSWIAAGAVEPHYSHLLQPVSELGARDAAHAWVVTVGIALLAGSLLALAAAFYTTLPRRRSVPALLFAVAGLAVLCTALFPLDCGTSVDHHCRAVARAGALSWHQDAHLQASFAAGLALALTPFALAWALWPGTAAAVALSAAAAGLAVDAGSVVASALPGAAGGLIQRLDLAVLHAWVLIVGAGILYATRASPRAARLIPMRPREFFATSWVGEAELVMRPLFLGRLLRQTGEARRSSTWISEQVWRIDDETRFASGRVERRHMYCEFVSDDHVELTAGDLPDGADVWLEEGGFRLPEWRMAWPVGPLPVLVRCLDRSRFEPDGTFVNVIDVRTIGLRIPVACITFRMRALDRIHSGELALEMT
jgi:hypothetical protein